MTDRTLIISACFQNKLCWTGPWLKNKGIQVICPGGHPDCTADLPPFAPFVGIYIGTNLALQGVLIRHVTTHGFLIICRNWQCFECYRSVVEGATPSWSNTFRTVSVSKMLQSHLQCRHVLWFNSWIANRVLLGYESQVQLDSKRLNETTHRSY